MRWAANHISLTDEKIESRDVIWRFSVVEAITIIMRASCSYYKIETLLILNRGYSNIATHTMAVVTSINTNLRRQLTQVGKKSDAQMVIYINRSLIKYINISYL